METKIIILFSVIDDYLKSINLKDDCQARMSTAEIMMITIAAASFFAGNQEKCRNFFKAHGYVRYMLSKSQFNRKLHAIDLNVWENLQRLLSQVFKILNETQEYSVDSFPVTVCQNIRINRCKIYRSEEFRGYNASKRIYFYGLKIHMIVTTKREPVEIIFAPGSISDAKIAKSFDFDLPEGAVINGDSMYTDYEFEELLKESAQLNLLPMRKSNSKRPHSPSLAYLIEHARKKVETAFSCITNLFPKKIHAVTSKGFELKILCFILAYSFSFL